MSRRPTTCEFLQPERQLAWRVLVVFTIYRVLFPLVLFSTSWHRAFDWLYRGTGWLVNGTMLVYLVDYAFLWLIVVWWGGLRRRDLGLDWSKLKSGQLWTLALWVTMQCVHAVITLAIGDPLQFNPAWAERGVTLVLGLLIAQLLGNALYEEMVFRHLFVSQIFSRCGILQSQAIRLIVVLLITQLFFAAIHIPHRLANGVALAALPEHLGWLLLMGLLYSWGYLQTRNLFFVVGWHALSNEPTMIIQQSTNPKEPLFGLVIVGLLVHLALLCIQRRRNSQKVIADQNSHPTG